MNESFATKIEDFAKICGKKFIIGVSGGGDSLALAKLCADFAKIHTDYKFLVVIIDHGIAKNSDEVAQIAKHRVEKIGLEAQILRIKSTISSAIQENARNLRYDLLCQAATEFGAKAILLAHNYDDQIETALFRMARGTGLIGLAAIAEIALPPNWQKNPSIVLVRPLLKQTRQELRDYLTENKIDYFDDPANENSMFSRVKIRKKIKKLAEVRIKFNRITDTIKIVQKFRHLFYLQCAKFILSNYHIENNKIFMPRIEYWPQNLAIEILETIIKTISQDNRNIKEQKIQNLYNNLQNKAFNGATLANVMIKNKKNYIVFSKAPLRRFQKNIEEISFDFKKSIFANFGLIKEYLEVKIK